MQNRFKISKQNRAIVDQIKDTKYLGNKNNFEAKNKDVFLLAASLGTDMPSDLTGPDQWFEEEDLGFEGKAMVYSIAYDELNDVDKLLDFESVRSILDRMANTGLLVLDDKIKNQGLDNVEKRMIAELDDIYSAIDF